MKKYIIALTAALVLAGPRPAHADAETITVKVTPTAASNISISPNPATADYGSVALSATEQQFPTSFVITNNGALATTLQLKINPVDGTWSAGASPASDVYRLRAIVNSVAPSASDFTVGPDNVTNSFKTCDSSIFAGPDQSCASIAPGATRTFWLLLDMPTGSTTATQRSFGVEINAL